MEPMETKKLKRVVLAMVTAWLVGSGAAHAQNFVEGTEDLDFDRPESWAMKFYASLSLLTSMGVPERMGAGTIDLGFDGEFEIEDSPRALRLKDASRDFRGGRVRSVKGILNRGGGRIEIRTGSGEVSIQASR